MFNLPVLKSLEQKKNLAFHEVKQIGTDLRILARFI
jgi:diaminohydroxyphosphoribosylaminopyrimidine deaminase/5-amino-6-(5-phosphoribosylamino)uracil reductase